MYGSMAVQSATTAAIGDEHARVNMVPRSEASKRHEQGAKLCGWGHALSV